MSVHVISWALKTPVKSGPKFVLVALANYADQDGRCWPCQKTLAADTSMDARTVRKHLKTLENDGIIKRERRNRDDGFRSSDLITIVGFDGAKTYRKNQPVGDEPTGRIVQTLPEESPAHEPSLEPSIPPVPSGQPPHGTRLPDNWILGEAEIEFAKAEGFSSDEISRIGDTFRDYWVGTAGQRGRKRDWLATWRNWIRREAGNRNRGSGGQQRYGRKVNSAVAAASRSLAADRREHGGDRNPVADVWGAEPGRVGGSDGGDRGRIPGAGD